MRNGSSTLTIPPDPVLGRDPAASDTPPLRVVSAEPSDTAPGTVVRVGIGPGQWALVVQPAEVEMLWPPPAPAGPFIRPVPSLFSLVRTSWLPDPRLGTAVLLYRGGHTLIYCPERDINDRAAYLLSALAGPALSVEMGCDHPNPRMTVTRVDHSLLPTDHTHVTSAAVRGCDIVFFVCSRLISARLADTLGLLCTAHARDLLQLGPLSTDEAASGS